MKASYTNLFIELGKFTFATVIVVTGCIASAAIASSQYKNAPQSGPLQTKSVQLAIKSPNMNVCPAQAKMAGWIHTNKPGKVSYMIAKKGAEVSGPYFIDAVKSVSGGGMASFSNSFQIQQATDSEYQILVANAEGKIVSDWVPLKASSTLQLAEYQN